MSRNRRSQRRGRRRRSAHRQRRRNARPAVRQIPPSRQAASASARSSPPTRHQSRCPKPRQTRAVSAPSTRRWA
eukprot:2125338-Pleurochrysis_carterae.AAC.1